MTDSAAAAHELYRKYKDYIFRDVQIQLASDVRAGKKIVLVYQMGKVGSTSYATALEKVDGISVMHIHRLNKRNTETMISRFLCDGMVGLAIKERRWQAVADFIDKCSHRIYILSAMRNPIDRNISAFFQNLEQEINANIKKLMKNFLESYNHQIPERWFEAQFLEALGVDIYRYPFDKKRGWGSFDCRNYKCLLVTAEADDPKKVEGLNSFLGTDIKSLPRKNIGAGKQYSVLYRKFKERLILPESYIDSQLNTRVVSHFYTSAKIDEFKQRWCQNIRPVKS